MYYTFEFASKASNYIRHALAVVTVANGELLCDCLVCTGMCTAGHLSQAHYQHVLTANQVVIVQIVVQGHNAMHVK